MENIKFVGREKELLKLKELNNQNFFLIVRGRRRIGKTLLLRKSFPQAIYLFIWPDKSLSWILEQISKEYSLPHFRDFGSLLSYLLDQEKVVIIDEFQNFLNVDKSVYGEIQKIIDQRKHGGAALKLAVAGSSYSLMDKVFYDGASPLYGRRTHEVNLKNLSIVSLFKELKISLEEFIQLWSVFEGVPYYYEFIDLKKSAKNNIFNLVLSKNSQLSGEGNAILSVEFGKDSKTYNTVLTSISEGKTKLNEIASVFNDKKNEVIKYLSILRRNFNLVTKITPIDENPKKSRIGKYQINDNFLSFWFYFYDRNQPYIEQRRFEELKQFFESQFDNYVGKKFEKFMLELIKENLIFSEDSYETAGNQWGKTETGTYEIDILALSKNNKILFGECKWSREVNPLEVLNKLEKKLKYVLVNRNGKEEVLVIFAKSFSKKVTEFGGKRVYCLDLGDIEKLLKGKKVLNNLSS